jgi:crossover junction endodeoxyribonuclease RuvC
MNRIIGIDPGSRCTGYGLVEGDGNRLHYLGCGCIRVPPKLAFAERLGLIFEELGRVIEAEKPAELAIEEVFIAKNVKSALLLGHARGAAMLAGVNAGLPVYEYSALNVKQAVVGYGRAEKHQVESMIRFLFRLRGPLNPNASDALAVAVCHLNTRASAERVELSEPS